MCRALNSKYTPPSRSYLSDTLIPSSYGVEKANVISELKDVPKLAITSDGWTSLRQDHYLTVNSALHKPGQCKTEGPPHQGSVQIPNWRSSGRGDRRHPGRVNR